MSLRNGGTCAFPLSARLAMLGLLLLTRCGGSGSSGFEAASEAAAVMRALDHGSCVVFNGTTYCGSGAALPLDNNTVSVRIDRARTPRSCTPEPPGGCISSVPFVPEGFPDGTVFRAAAAATAEGPWTLTPQGSDPRVIEVQKPPAQPLLVAVLAYTSAVPDDLPGEAVRLADFRADAVYLRDPFTGQNAP